MIGCVKTVLKRESLKPEVINSKIIGHIDTIDDHGNAVTNIPENLFARLEWQIGGTLEVEFPKGRKVQCQYVKDYGDVPVGDYLCRFSSEGLLKIAINQGYLAENLKLEKLSKVIIRKIK